MKTLADALTALWYVVIFALSVQRGQIDGVFALALLPFIIRVFAENIKSHKTMRKEVK